LFGQLALTTNAARPNSDAVRRRSTPFDAARAACSVLAAEAKWPRVAFSARELEPNCQRSKPQKFPAIDDARAAARCRNANDTGASAAKSLC